MDVLGDWVTAGLREFETSFRRFTDDADGSARLEPLVKRASGMVRFQRFRLTDALDSTPATCVCISDQSNNVQSLP